MPKPREIREKALLALFAHAAHKGDVADDAIWNLALEPEQNKITKSTAKALKHQLSALPQRAEGFNEIAALLLPVLQTYEYKSEARSLRSLLKLIDELSTQFSSRDWLEEQSTQHQFCHQALALGSSLSEMKGQLSGLSFDFVPRSNFDKALNALIDLTQRVSPIVDPLSESNQTANSGLAKASQEYEELRIKASEFTQGAVDNIEKIDSALAEHLENFTAEQIGRVERSLLRLAAYEIIVLKMPKGIVINESLELTRKYTTEDAVPLINGVLDKLVA